MKRQFLIVAIACSLTSFTQAALREEGNRQLIESAFWSACGHAPDPSSLSYYLQLINEREETPENVQRSIWQSYPASQKEICRHVSGLNDYCKS